MPASLAAARAAVRSAREWAAGDYLAYFDDRVSYPPVVLFRHWLLKEFARDNW